MTQELPKFDFLIEYVLALLEKNNINLDEEQKKMYVPQILAQLELRLGLELMTKLNDEQKEEFSKMFEDFNTSSEQWNIFWHKSIPTFDEDVNLVLMAFAEKVKKILS